MFALIARGYFVLQLRRAIFSLKSREVLKTFPPASLPQTSTRTVYFSLQSSLKSFVAEEDLAKLVGRPAGHPPPHGENILKLLAFNSNLTSIVSICKTQPVRNLEI